MALGHVFPGFPHVTGAMEIAKVKLLVAARIRLMIIPILIKIDFATLGNVYEHWRGIGVAPCINWAVKPLSMAALGWLFIGTCSSAICLPTRSSLHRRPDRPRRRVLHSHGICLDDVTMVVASAPVAGLLLGLFAIRERWDTLALSVAWIVNRNQGWHKARRQAAGGHCSQREVAPQHGSSWPLPRSANFDRKPVQESSAAGTGWFP